MGIFDTIKKNFNESEVGGAINSLPKDTRTVEQKMQDMVANNPNTPKAVTPQIPAQPMPGLGGTQGPAPASIETPVAQPAPLPAPQGNWAIKANPNQAAVNPYAAGMQAGSQIANMMPTQGAKMQMGGVKENSNALSQGYEEQSKAQDEQLQAMDASNARVQEIAKEREGAQKDFETKYNQGLEELKGMEIDSGRMWKNASTGQKILTGIGLALSAFGGPEAVAKTNQIITQAIDRDIEDQKAAYSKKKEGLQNMQSVYGRMLERFGDKEKAELATKNFYLEKAKLKMDQISNRTNSKTAKAQAQIAMGQIQSQIDDTKGKIMLALGTSQATAPIKSGTTLPDNYSPRSEEEKKNLVNGYGLAGDPESAKKMRETVKAVSDLTAMISEAKKLREKSGGETFGKDAGALKRLTKQLQLKIKDVESMGALSEGEWSILGDIIPELDRYDTPGRQPVIDALTQLENQAKGKLQRAVQLNIVNPLTSVGAKVNRGGV